MGSQPFLPAGAYKAMALIGALLACFLIVPMYYLMLQLRKVRLQQLQILDSEETGVDNDAASPAKDNSETPTSTVSDPPPTQSTWWRLHAFALLETLLLSVFTPLVDWRKYFGLLVLVHVALVVAFDVSSKLQLGMYQQLRTLSPSENAHKKMISAALGAVLAFMFMSLHVAEVSYVTMPFAHYTYLGPMRVVNFANLLVVESDTDDPNHSKQVNVVLEQVAWGRILGVSGVSGHVLYILRRNHHIHLQHDRLYCS
jgi:hypothetical protein